MAKNRTMEQKHLLAKKQKQKYISENNRHHMSCTERVNSHPDSVNFQLTHKLPYASYPPKKIKYA